MNFSEYKGFVLDTVLETYPKYSRITLLKDLEACGIKIKKGTEGLGNGIVDISNLFSDDDKIRECFKDNDTKAIRCVEQYEFFRSYKYSVLFEYDDQESLLKELISKKLVRDFDEESEGVDDLGETTPLPSMCEREGKIFLKFNFAFRGYDPVKSKDVKLKYPLLIVLFKDLGVAEIRFDRIGSIFKDTKEFSEFYKRKILFAKNWLSNVLKANLKNLDLKVIVDNIKEESASDVILYSQFMSMKTGAKAKLEIGGDMEVLPILGELQQLIDDNASLFESVAEVKELLDNFIQEIKVTSETPWVQLCWKKTKERKKMIVKFSHDILDEQYTLLQHLGEQQGMERMNYVTKYLVEYKRDHLEQADSESDSA